MILCPTFRNPLCMVTYGNNLTFTHGEFTIPTNIIFFIYMIYILPMIDINLILCDPKICNFPVIQ